MPAFDNSHEGRHNDSDAGNASTDLFDIETMQNQNRCSSGCCAEEDGYKRLILAELNRQKMNVSDLEPHTRMTRSTLNRTIRGNYRLSDELRHKCFDALGIDRHQAYITVAMLRDVKKYHSPEAHFLAQNLRAVQEDVCNARKGAITDFFRPAIIDQAAKLGVKSILDHQEKIRAEERVFLSK